MWFTTLNSSSNSVIEALNFGIPVLGYNSGSMSEIIDDKIGRLVEIDKNFQIANLPASYDPNFTWSICGNLVPLVSGAPPDFRGNAPGIRGRLCLILRFKL